MANGHVGARINAGNKEKQDFEKTNNIFIEAIKQVKNVETDDEARIALAVNLLEFERGIIFVSEHIFGKPTNHVDHSTMGEKLQNIINLGVGVNPEENK
jgi:hypothetical protein